MLIDPVFSPATEYIHTHTHTHVYVCTQLVNIFFSFFHLFCFYFFKRKKKDRNILSASCFNKQMHSFASINDNHITISNFSNIFSEFPLCIFFFRGQIKQCANSCAMRISDLRLFSLIYFYNNFFHFVWRKQLREEKNIEGVSSSSLLQSSNSLNYFLNKYDHFSEE